MADTRAPTDSTVRISGPARQTTTLVVNSRAVEVPHNRDVPLAGPYVEALQNSARTATIKPGVQKGATILGADPKATADALTDTIVGGGGVNQTPGGDNTTHAPPQEPALAVRTGGAVEQEPGADNTRHAGAEASGAGIGVVAELRQQADHEEARETSAAALDGTIEPAVVLRNDAEQAPPQGVGATDAGTGASGAADSISPPDRDGDGKPGGRVNNAKILEGTVPEVLEAAKSLKPDQVRSLVAAEKKGQNRSGIINALDA